MNDFGFAGEAGVSTRFCGTIRYAPTDTLRKLAANPNDLIEAKCWHDLESAVKLTVSLAFSLAMPPQAATAEQSLAHWAMVEQRSMLQAPLQQLLQSARSGNYAVLIAQLTAWSVPPIAA